MVNFLLTLIFISLSSFSFANSWNLNSFEKQIKGEIDSITVEKLNQYWVPPKSLKKKQCFIKYSHLTGEFSFSKIAKRTKSRYLINFANYYGIMIANSIAGNDVEKIKIKILEIASNEYFSKPDMKKGWSPIYVQSNIIRLTAFYINHLKKLDNIKPDEENLLRKWIKPMIKYQKGFKMNGSDDSRAASGVALMTWGAEINDISLFKKGIKNWTESLNYIFSSVGKLKRQEAHRNVSLRDLSLEDEFNLTLGHVLEGYVLLENIGLDVDKIKYKNLNIKKTVEWWVNELRTKINWDVLGRPKPINNFNFKGTRRTSHNWHLGWIPIYLSNPRGDVVKNYLDKMVYHISYNYALNPYFKGISLGVATDCLWGYSTNIKLGGKKNN